MKIQKLNWDSQFFGYQIGKMELENFHIEEYENLRKQLFESGIKLVYIYPIDQVSKSTLIFYKIPLASTTVTFKKKDIFYQDKSNKTRPYDKNDPFETIEKLAFISGEYSRFKTDKNFLNNEFFRLYSEWIKKSISKEIANDVIVYKETEKILGFVSYKITPTNEIIIGLIAVDPSKQGQGIGKTLMQSIENIAFQNNIKIILVSTQLENKQSMAFYHSCGYTIISQQEIYHLWIQ